MSERPPASPDDRFRDVTISRSSERPDEAVYSIGDDVTVAAVQGRHVQFFDGDGLAEEFDCESPEAAGHQALAYAALLQRPLPPGGRR